MASFGLYTGFHARRVWYGGGVRAKGESGSKGRNHTFLRAEPLLERKDGILTGVTGWKRLGVLVATGTAGEMLILRVVNGRHVAKMVLFVKRETHNMLGPRTK